MLPNRSCPKPRTLAAALWTVLSLTAVAATGVLAPLQSVRAEAPAVKTQVPGYYRHMVGDVEVTALYDGQILLDTAKLRNATPQEMQRLLARLFRDNPTPTAVNAYLLNVGGKLVLVDAGAAGKFGPQLGQVLANLKASGYEPAQVDAVLLTHLHGDHVSGLLTPDGQVAFPNATVHVAKAEADFWLSAEQMNKAPEAMRGFFKMAQDAVAAYRQVDRLKTFDGQKELLPGILSVPMPGHTPGHTGYLVQSKGQRLLIWGDLVHNAAVQLPRPEVTIEFDVDPRQALRMRKDVFKRVVKDGFLVAGMHLPFPGLGHVRDEPKGYEWVPIDFGPLPAPSATPAATPAKP